MESIQLAQMLADLSDLNAAQESRAAVALVEANKTLAPTSEPNLKTPEQRHHQRVQSASGIISRTASPAKFDKFGRRILTPPMTRTNSAQGSIPGTPRHHTEAEDDVDRATSLMALYEIRAKLRQQDTTSLMKVREKIVALAAQQQAQRQHQHQLLQQQQQQHAQSGHATPVGPHQTADANHSRFTYPRESS